MYITNINLRDSTLLLLVILSRLANCLGDFKKFLFHQLHLIDDLITNYTHSAAIRVISDNNTISHKTLAIVSPSSVAIRNGLLSVGKRLKGIGFYVHADPPKEVQESCKLLRQLFCSYLC